MPDPSPSTLTVLQLGRRSGGRPQRTVYPRRLPVNTVIHTTNPQPSHCWSDALPVVPPTHTKCHRLTLSHLECTLGLCGLVLGWILSYITEWTQWAWFTRVTFCSSPGYCGVCVQREGVEMGTLYDVQNKNVSSLRLKVCVLLVWRTLSGR